MEDMGEFLKKALQGEMNVNETEEEMHSEMNSYDDLDPEFKTFTEVLSGKKLAELGKAAIKRKIKIAKDLSAYLHDAESEAKDEARWLSKVSFRIQRDAKAMGVLDTIVTFCTTGIITYKGDSLDECIDTVIKLSTII